jgi:hypothetical protein
LKIANRIEVSEPLFGVALKSGWTFLVNTGSNRLVPSGFRMQNGLVILEQLLGGVATGAASTKSVVERAV